MVTQFRQQRGVIEAQHGRTAEPPKRCDRGKIVTQFRQQRVVQHGHTVQTTKSGTTGPHSSDNKEV